jgi:lipoyl-dependent peroxiredoxin
MKTVHIAEVLSEGGRTGKIESSNGKLSVHLSMDHGPSSVTSEDLFAGAYASCFLGALLAAAEKAHQPVKGATLKALVHLDEDNAGGWQLAVELRATLPGIGRSDAEKLLHQAHTTCPYSKATRGNVTVKLTLD